MYTKRGIYKGVYLFFRVVEGEYIDGKASIRSKWKGFMEFASEKDRKDAAGDGLE